MERRDPRVAALSHGLALDAPTGRKTPGWVRLGLRDGLVGMGRMLAAAAGVSRAGAGAGGSQHAASASFGSLSSIRCSVADVDKQSGMALVCAIEGDGGSVGAWWVPAQALRLPGSSWTAWPTSRHAQLSKLPGGNVLARANLGMLRNAARGGSTSAAHAITSVLGAMLQQPCKRVAEVADVAAAGSALDACMWLACLAVDVKSPAVPVAIAPGLVA